MGDLVEMAGVMVSTDDPDWHRAVCKVCSWASHPGGTDHAGAVLAAIAHIESAHQAQDIQVDAVEDA